MTTPDMRLVPAEPTEAMLDAFEACPGNLEMACQDFGMQRRADLKARLSASLAASPSPSVEAVAWRWKISWLEGWAYSDGPEHPSFSPNEPGKITNLQPLYTHPAPDASAVREGCVSVPRDTAFKCRQVLAGLRESPRHTDLVSALDEAIDATPSEPGREELRAQIDATDDNAAYATELKAALLKSQEQNDV